MPLSEKVQDRTFLIMTTTTMATNATIRRIKGSGMDRVTAHDGLEREAVSACTASTSPWTIQCSRLSCRRVSRPYSSGPWSVARRPRGLGRRRSGTICRRSSIASSTGKSGTICEAVTM